MSSPQDEEHDSAAIFGGAAGSEARHRQPACLSPAPTNLARGVQLPRRITNRPGAAWGTMAGTAGRCSGCIGGREGTSMEPFGHRSTTGSLGTYGSMSRRLFCRVSIHSAWKRRELNNGLRVAGWQRRLNQDGQAHRCRSDFAARRYPDATRVPFELRRAANVPCHGYVAVTEWSCGPRAAEGRSVSGGTRSSLMSCVRPWTVWTDGPTRRG